MGLYFHLDAGGGRVIAALHATRLPGAPPMEAAVAGSGPG